MRFPFATLRNLALLGAALFLVGACATGSAPTDHYYRLAMTGDPVTWDQPMTEVLEVQRPIAGGLLDNRPLVYGDGAHAHELRAYHYHFWADRPSTMLQGELVDFLRAAGVAKQVITPDLRARADRVVSGRIRRLEQIRGDRPGIAVDLELILSDRSGVLMVKDYRRVVETRDASVTTAVAAINTALGDIARTFVDDLKAAQPIR